QSVLVPDGGDYDHVGWNANAGGEEDQVELQGFRSHTFVEQSSRHSLSPRWKIEVTTVNRRAKKSADSKRCPRMSRAKPNTNIPFIRIEKKWKTAPKRMRAAAHALSRIT